MSLRFQRDCESPTPNALGPLRWYWPSTLWCLLVGAVATFGLLAVGLPILFFGLVLSALAPARDNRKVLWPALVGTAFFVLTAFLLAPGSCTSTTTGVGQPTSITTCTS